MAKDNSDAGSAAGASTLTLTEVAKRTGISMPTLQKYKKRFGDRIPSVGKGRAQRYPEGSLDVFRQLRDENMSRRGRPRKNASGAQGAAAPKAAKAAKPTRGRRAAAKGRSGAAATSGGDDSGLLTLTQVAKKTGISYPTLMRYVKTHSDKLASVGSGRRRRFKPESIEAFQALRGESRKGRKAAASGNGRRGRRPASAASAPAPAAAAINGRRGRGGRPAAGGGNGDNSGLRVILERLEKRLARVEEALRKPIRVEVRR
jgi:DNA-binding transcriptional MerR regulator